MLERLASRARPVLERVELVLDRAADVAVARCRGLDSRRMSQAALMARAGHSDLKTTQGRRGFSLLRGETERRRSRTDPAVGYTTSPVLKTGWATGPGRSTVDATSAESPLVADPERDVIVVEPLEDRLRRLP
jgi:hypothetical protein